MRKTKTFAKMILITLTLVSLFFVPASCAINTESPSDEIERIECGDNSRTTYFKNGTKLVEVSSQLNIVITTTTTTTTFTLTKMVPPINILENTKLIIEIVFLSVCIVATILGIFGITLYKRSKKELKYIELREFKSKLKATIIRK